MVLREVLDKIWLCRLDQRIEDVIALTSEAKAHAQSSGFNDPDLTKELRLIDVSILRARGEIDAAETLLHEVERSYIEKCHPLPGRLLMERGLNHFYRENFYDSLENFLVASRRGNELPPVALAQAKLNALLCAEYLGIKRETLETECEREMANLNGVTTDGLKSQWSAYQLRQEFTRGQFDSLVAKDVLSQMPWSQAVYLSLYYRRLPYVQIDQDDEGVLLPSFAQYHVSYRYRTLKGDLHPADLQTQGIKCADQIERIYLWTWYWLTRPDFPLAKILQTIEALPEDLPGRPLSLASQMELKLALRWISLFEKSQETLLRPLLNLHPDQDGKSSTIYELESLILYVLSARLTSQNTHLGDSHELMKTHPLWLNAQIGWKSFFAELDKNEVNPSGRLKHLFERISTEQTTLHQRSNGLHVDLSRFEIKSLDHDRTLVSESVARAMALLSKTSSVSCQQFVNQVFGFNTYDKLDHDPRIFNVLARVRAHLPKGLALKKRGDRIITVGDWRLIQISGSLEHTSVDFHPPSLLLHKRRKLAIKKDEARLLARLGAKAFCRRDLERLSGQSRPSANRLLERWKKSGLISCIGQGPDRRYEITKIGSKS